MHDILLLLGSQNTDRYQGTYNGEECGQEEEHEPGYQVTIDLKLRFCHVVTLQIW